MTEMDVKFMQRALDLAELGKGNVSPNPMVGCVIVYNDRIIGEGWHDHYGGPHAEPNAIKDVKDKSLLSESTIYVTLEPCAHYGKTPPCTDLIISFMPKRVVICNEDPNPLVAGKGIRKMRELGIKVDTGVLYNKGREINKRFFTFHEKHRPYIILKWAQTADRFVARQDYTSKWISNELSRKKVHFWRSEEDAVMVGTNTAIYDNPALNVRLCEGRNPKRIVIDKTLRIPQTHLLFDQQQETFVYNAVKDEVVGNTIYVKIDFDNNIILPIIQDLYERKIMSIFVEGGSQLLNAFLEIGIWDEARVFTSDQRFETGIGAPLLFSPIEYSTNLENDELTVYYNK